jgi:hypothetical protein
MAAAAAAMVAGRAAAVQTSCKTYSYSIWMQMKALADWLS